MNTPTLQRGLLPDERLSAVGKLTAEYGRVGGNLNQIARYHAVMQLLPGCPREGNLHPTPKPRREGRVLRA